MAIELEVLLALQVSAMPDTVVSLVIPPEPTVFDYARGTLQILVLVVGFFALGAMALLALTLRKSIVALQSTVDRLSTDVKPLLHQATRLSEDAHDIVKTVRREVDRLADATGEVSERILDLSDAAEDRIDQVNALLNVLQDEVQDTALSAVAAARGLKVGAVALGAALVGNGSHRTAPRKSRKQAPRIRAREDADAPLFDDDTDGGDAIEDVAEDVAEDVVDSVDDFIEEHIDDESDDYLDDDDVDPADDDDVVDDADVDDFDESRPYFDDTDDDSAKSDESAARRRRR